MKFRPTEERTMTENNSSGKTPTVKRRDVLKATGTAAAGGALLVGATGSAAAHCPGKCIEFTSSDSNPPGDIQSVTIDGKYVEVCAATACDVLTIYIKAANEVTTLQITSEETNEGAKTVCKDTTLSTKHAISNVTVCPSDDQPGYCKNNPNVNC